MNPIEYEPGTTMDWGGVEVTELTPEFAEWFFRVFARQLKEQKQ